MQNHRMSSVGLFLLAALSSVALSACAGRGVDNKSQENQSDAPTLGQVRTSEGETEIQTQRQVVITENSEIPTIRTSALKGDLNRMEKQHFVALGFSEDLAERIIDRREDQGGFKSMDEVKQVEGMDEQSFAMLQDRLAVAPSG